MADDTTGTDDGTDDGSSGSSGSAGGSGSSTSDGGAGGGTEGKTFSQEDVDRLINDRLARERRKYADYDDLKAKAKAQADAAKANQTLEERVEALQRDLAERDSAAVAEKAELATERLHAKLVRGGIGDDDATALVGTIDPLRLLDDGKPSAEEIDKVAKTLTKLGSRAQADPDQGAKGGNTAPSMNDLIRQAAGRSRVG